MMDELLKWISITDRHNKIYLDKKFKDIGLNSSQYFYILKIYENPSITQDKLIDIIHLNPSNITRALCQLEKLGFIERISKKDDKRTYNLYPTEKALEVYPKIKKIMDEWINFLLSNFSEDEKECLLNLTKKISINSLEASKL